MTTTISPRLSVSEHSAQSGGTSVSPASPHTIREVQVAEFRDGSGKLYDRRMVLVLACGHYHNLSIPLDAPVPQVGWPSSWFCLSCHVAGDA